MGREGSKAPGPCLGECLRGKSAGLCVLSKYTSRVGDPAERVQR